MVTEFHVPDDLRRRGRRRSALPDNAPLSAAKMMSLLAYLHWPSDRAFGAAIGTSHDVVARWHRGKSGLRKKDKLLIAHVYDVPVDWWEARDEAVTDAIARAQSEKRKRYEKAIRAAASSQKGGESSVYRGIMMPDYGRLDSWRKVVKKDDRRVRRIEKAGKRDKEH